MNEQEWKDWEQFVHDVQRARGGCKCRFCAKLHHVLEPRADASILAADRIVQAARDYAAAFTAYRETHPTLQRPAVEGISYHLIRAEDDLLAVVGEL